MKFMSGFHNYTSEILKKFAIGVSMFVVQRLVEMCAEASGMILQPDMISPCKFGVKTS